MKNTLFTNDNLFILHGLNSSEVDEIIKNLFINIQ